MVGITKEDIKETSTTYLGRKWLDWCFWSDYGLKGHKDKWVKFHEWLNEGEMIVILVDRIKGTVGFTVHDKYLEAFQDEEIKTGTLNFACCAGFKDQVFEIE